MKMLIPYGAHRYRGKSSDGNADLFKNVRWFGKFRVFRNEIRTIPSVRPPLPRYDRLIVKRPIPRKWKTYENKNRTTVFFE